MTCARRRTLTAGLAVGAFALLLAACAPPPAQKADPDAGRGVAELLDRWAAAGSQGRWDDLKGLYADDSAFAWVEQGRLAYPTHAAAAAGVDAAARSGAKIVTRVSAVSVAPLGPETAAFRAQVRMSYSSAQTNFDFDGVITGVAVWRDGQWKFLQGHLSAPK